MVVTCVVGDGLSWSTISCFHHRTKIRECDRFASSQPKNSIQFENRKLLGSAALLQSLFFETDDELRTRRSRRRGSDLRSNGKFGYAQQGFQTTTKQHLRVAYTTTTENIVSGGRLRPKELGKRQLILLRHAKSSWSDRSLKDHERPLSKRGRQAAADIANKLEQQGWSPGLILCSDAVRTRETLDIMQAHASDLREAAVRFLGSFYSIAAMDGQTAQHLQESILKYSSDDVTTVMCMGHNRGWEEAASLLSGVSVELKTANAALLEAPGSSWQEVSTKEMNIFNSYEILGPIKLAALKHSISVWFMISTWESY
jgi:phosphohistidine phosphatase SixA